jgi:hypothetical protein
VRYNYYLSRFAALACVLILIFVIKAKENNNDEQLKLYGVRIEGYVVELKSESRTLFKRDKHYGVVAYKYHNVGYYTNIPNPDDQVQLNDKFSILCSYKDPGVSKILSQ